VETETISGQRSTGQIAGHELVGHRLVGAMPSQPLVNIWIRITSRIVKYLERYYREGAIPPWRECVGSGQPLIKPQPIPPLEHKQMEVRFAF